MTGFTCFFISSIWVSLIPTPEQGRRTLCTHFKWISLLTSVFQVKLSISNSGINEAQLDHKSSLVWQNLQLALLDRMLFHHRLFSDICYIVWALEPTRSLHANKWAGRMFNIDTDRSSLSKLTRTYWHRLGDVVDMISKLCIFVYINEDIHASIHTYTSTYSDIYMYM
jgi:hypothetical protein